MFVVFLKFSKKKAIAGEFMDGHNQWIKRGFNDAVFLTVGSLQPNQGGAILAHNTTRADLQLRLNEDPFVKENIVTCEIFEISPKMAGDRLNVLLAD